MKQFGFFKPRGNSEKQIWDIKKGVLFREEHFWKEQDWKKPKPPHLLSHQCHEVEVCPGKRSIGGKSNHGSILRQLCRYCLKGTRTRSPCEYWHPPECQFFKTYATSSKYPGKERTIAWKNTRQSSSSAKSLRKSQTKMVTANGEVQTREEATVSVKELDPFVPQFFLSGSSARIMGIHTTGSAVRNHISSKMARELIATNQTMCHSWCPGLSASSSTTPTALPSSSSQDSVFDVSRYTENTVPERSGSTSEELLGDPLRRSTLTEHEKSKWRTRRSTKLSITWLAGLAAWVQREFGRWTWSSRATVKPWAWISRHLQFFSWITNGVASKSGIGYG